MEDRLAGLVTKLYGQYVRSAVRKGLLEYLHISKSGGTTFSVLANRSSCNVSLGMGQLEELDDQPRWINATAFAEVTRGADIMWSAYGQVERQSATQGCRARLHRVASLGLNYVSNEYTLHGGLHSMRDTHVCAQAFNVVTLRHPGDRLASHLHYMLARVKRRMAHRKDEAEAEAFFHRVFCSDDDAAARVLEAVAPPVVDNYIVRSFLGESGFHSPVGSIGDAALGVARRLLLQFDLVLDLGAGDEAFALVITQGLGWRKGPALVHARAGSSVYDQLKYSPEECPLDRVMGLLMARHGPDMELYRLGRALSFLDRLLLRLSRTLGLRPTPSRLDPSPGWQLAPAAPPAANRTAINATASCGLLAQDVRHKFAMLHGVRLDPHARRSHHHHRRRRRRGA